MYLESHPATSDLLKRTIQFGVAQTSGSDLLDHHLDPMVASIYKDIGLIVDAERCSIEDTHLYIGELSVFARYNATFLTRAASFVSGFCPELAHELNRNFLEEGGERGKLPAHYVLFTGALIEDLDFMVNGWVPRAQSTRDLLSMIDILSWSHCPSTILGMYYATESVAISETEQLRALTNRLGQLQGGGKLAKLDNYYRIHLDENHEAATEGIAVERGHQDGIARFIREAETFGFLQPQIIDGFLQILHLFVNQWIEIASITSRAG
ncbi:MAG: hypothetical protein ACKPGQ_20265 [Dolichospermum sp.]